MEDEQVIDKLSLLMLCHFTVNFSLKGTGEVECIVSQGEIWYSCAGRTVNSAFMAAWTKILSYLQAAQERAAADIARDAETVRFLTRNANPLS